MKLHWIVIERFIVLQLILRLSWITSVYRRPRQNDRSHINVVAHDSENPWRRSVEHWPVLCAAGFTAIITTWLPCYWFLIPIRGRIISAGMRAIYTGRCWRDALIRSLVRRFFPSWHLAIFISLIWKGNNVMNGMWAESVLTLCDMLN